MVDFEKMFNLMERIDKDYKKYVNIKKEINEAKKNTFSYEVLDDIVNNCRLKGEYDFPEAIEYCRQQLGPEIGRGSSRYVFQIDDEFCLKLAYNNKGIQQNKVEANTNSNNSPLFPIIGKKSKYNAWIVTEVVLTANYDDFEHCLGMDFGKLTEIIQTIKDSNDYYDSKQEVDELIANDKTGFFKELYDYIIDYDIPIGDMGILENWGMTRRYDKDCIVLLDAGWNKETWKMYFQR